MLCSVIVGVVQCTACKPIITLQCTALNKKSTLCVSLKKWSLANYNKKLKYIWVLIVMQIRVGPNDTKVPNEYFLFQNPMRLSIKIPKNHSLTFWNHPDGSPTTRLPGLDLGHLGVPWEWLSGPKLKIYVKTIYPEHFSFHEKNLVISDFWDFM